MVRWGETYPAFNTQLLSDTEAPVREQFSFPNVIYLGSHHGCGCGFMSGGRRGSERKGKSRKYCTFSVIVFGRCPPTWRASRNVSMLGERPNGSSRGKEVAIPR